MEALMDLLMIQTRSVWLLSVLSQRSLYNKYHQGRTNRWCGRQRAAPHNSAVKGKLMKIFIILIISLPLFLSEAHADEIKKPGKPFITASDGGAYYFINVDEKFHFEENIGIIQDSPAFGKAYKVLDDGNSKEIWSVVGWYGGRLFLSMDGQYLIRVIGLIIGNEPSQEHLAIAFYKNGVEIARYSPIDLIENVNNVIHTSSSYMWTSEDSYNKIVPEYPYLDLYAFYLKTVEDIIYVFNCTTGEIIKTIKP